MPSQTQSTRKDCSIFQKKRQRQPMPWELATADCPGGGPAHDWQVDYTGPMLLALGDYKWVLTRIDTYSYSGLSSAYPVIDANAQNTIKGLQQ